MNPLAHGCRRMYSRGCRCRPCRAANAGYVAARRADTASRSALVSADAARVHLATVQAQGVGIRQAARLAGVSPSVIQDIKNGRLTAIREATAQRILTIPPVLAHGQVVTGWRTWRLVRLLGKEGFKPAEVARRLGLRTRKLRFDHSHVRVRTALRMRLLHQRLTEEGPGDSA